jgi:hypothetical protein
MIRFNLVPEWEWQQEPLPFLPVVLLPEEQRA